MNVYSYFLMELPLPPRLQDLLSQLSKVPAQLEHELKYLLHAPTVAPSPTEAEPSAEVVQVENKLTELWSEIETAKTRLIEVTAKHDATVADLERWADDVAKADAEFKAISAEASAAAAIIQQLAEERQRLEFQRVQSQDLATAIKAERSELEILQERLTTRESAVTQREHDVIKREHEVIKRGERLEATRYWLERLLPDWLQEEHIAPWRDAILDDAKHPHTSSNAAGLLFANLSLYTYAQRETDARAVADAVRDVSRRLFAWLKERNLGDYEASNVAQSWAEQINRECAGRCEIEVPVPGTPAQSQTMLYQPRPGVSAQSVLTVQSWCVRGAKREVIHRANVTV